MKNKKIRLHFQNKNLQSTLLGSKMCFESDLDRKNSPKRPKNILEEPKKVQNRPKMWPKQKQKDRTVLPKPKLIVYIGKSTKMFLNLTQTPEIAPKGSKKCKKGSNCGQIENKKMGL